MTDQEVEAFLEHYGVMGMKWGVRNEKRGRSRKERRASNRAFNERNASKRIKRTPSQQKLDKRANRVSAVVAGVMFLATSGRMMNTSTRVVLASGSALATQKFIKDRYDNKLSKVRR